ncbi:STAS domain-containing protein [Streptomyces sp. WAC 00631]|uniref:STAS domain-containing protein n=1 Tax=unclassified Streptomyces TaxID=2593676 RepID=UPI000F76CBE8|nr:MULTISPECIES: STAS domain-containing protein [unclassified Streptomyces]MCC5034427.1 STAS domain-containing protein [Streptomyces sp. WAC 00631]MCC9742200.1 STAS domain-containing protein [Streptomyces sp. MNU89]
MTEPLSLSVHHADGPLALLRVEGELDLETAATLRSRGLELMDAGRRHLVLDLAPVPFCDSSGLNAFINLLRHAGEHNGSLTLAAPPHSLSRLLELTGVGRLIPVHASADDALAAVRAGLGGSAPEPPQENGPDAGRPQD